MTVLSLILYKVLYLLAILNLVSDTSSVPDPGGTGGICTLKLHQNLIFTLIFLTNSVDLMQR